MYTLMYGIPAKNLCHLFPIFAVAIIYCIKTNYAEKAYD
jgi:hypothetical protein